MNISDVKTVVQFSVGVTGSSDQIKQVNSYLSLGWVLLGVGSHDGTDLGGSGGHILYSLGWPSEEKPLYLTHKSIF